MHTTRLAAIAVLFLAAACAGRGNDASSTADTTTVAVAAPSEAARAAAIANAIMAVPTSSDSILTANGLTADQFEAMIYRIARDSVASAEYGRLTAR
jgi:hypothetical protein